MLRYRVWVEIPGKDRAQQAICATQKMAEDFLKLILDAGQPKGTRWRIYRSDEIVLQDGTVE